MICAFCCPELVACSLNSLNLYYREKFQLIEQQAAHLSKSLGVGKLSDPKLSPTLLGFVRVGVKFAFSNDDNDELLLGSRLSFLSILSK